MELKIELFRRFNIQRAINGVFENVVFLYWLEYVAVCKFKTQELAPWISTHREIFGIA
jgi:hypothetical protein